MDKLLTAKELCRVKESEKKLKEKVTLYQEIQYIINQIKDSLNNNIEYFPNQYSENPYEYFPEKYTLDKLLDLGYKIEESFCSFDVKENKIICEGFWNKIFRNKKEIRVVKETKILKTLTISACCDSVPRPGVD